jgi:hypothetical protein
MAQQKNWYIDPLDSTRARYWDGAKWGDVVHTIPPGQHVPSFVADQSPGAGWTAASPVGVAPAWGAPPPPPGQVPGMLPPPPPAAPPYVAYSSYQGPQRTRNSGLVISGAFSLVIGLLLVLWDVTSHLGPFSVIVATLISVSGAVRIARGLR